MSKNNFAKPPGSIGDSEDMFVNEEYPDDASKVSLEFPSLSNLWGSFKNDASKGLSSAKEDLVRAKTELAFLSRPKKGVTYSLDHIEQTCKRLDKADAEITQYAKRHKKKQKTYRFNITNTKQIARYNHIHMGDGRSYLGYLKEESMARELHLEDIMSFQAEVILCREKLSGFARDAREYMEYSTISFNESHDTPRSTKLFSPSARRPPLASTHRKMH